MTELPNQAEALARKIAPMMTTACAVRPTDGRAEWLARRALNRIMKATEHIHRAIAAHERGSFDAGWREYDKATADIRDALSDMEQVS